MFVEHAVGFGADGRAALCGELRAAENAKGPGGVDGAAGKEIAHGIVPEDGDVIGIGDVHGTFVNRPALVFQYHVPAVGRTGKGIPTEQRTRAVPSCDDRFSAERRAVHMTDRAVRISECDGSAGLERCSQTQIGAVCSEGDIVSIGDIQLAADDRPALVFQRYVFVVSGDQSPVPEQKVKITFQL